MFLSNETKKSNVMLVERRLKRKKKKNDKKSESELTFDDAPICDARHRTSTCTVLKFTEVLSHCFTLLSEIGF